MKKKAAIWAEAQAALAESDHDPELEVREFREREARVQEERRRRAAEAAPLTPPPPSAPFTPAQDEALAVFVRRECERTTAGLREELVGLADEAGDICGALNRRVRSLEQQRLDDMRGELQTLAAVRTELAALRKESAELRGRHKAEVIDLPRISLKGAA